MRVFWLVLWPQMRWLRAQNWPHWSVLMYIHKLNSFPTAQKHLGWQRQAVASTDLQGAKWGPWRALRAPHMHFNEFVGVALLEQGLFDPIPWRKTLETGRYCDLLKAPPSITSLTHCGWRLGKKSFYKKKFHYIFSFFNIFIKTWNNDWICLLKHFNLF